jgi:phospholipid/cholesterol/gamma-HCH transport system permease protein
MSVVDSRQEDGQHVLVLQGHWTAATVAAAREALAGVALEDGGALSIDTREVTLLDLAGAWALDEFLRLLAARRIRVSFVGPAPDALRVVREALEHDEGAHPGDSVEERWANPVHLIGQTTIDRLQSVKAGLAFIGRSSSALLSALAHWRRLRPVSIVRHVWDTGITALPIVSLIAFLISVIIAYLSATQLRQFGADIFVVDLITIGVLRELGVLLTAIIIAGRSGSAFAAEIGAMKLNDEVDALDAAGVDSIEVLVLPRIIGLTIAMPLLTVVADLIGIAGGALLCHSLLDMPIQQFIHRAETSIAPTTFWVGIWKAPVFAVLISLAGTYRGLQVRGSSRELGRLTTLAVVQSIFLVLLADALFAMLFMKLDV